MNIFVFAHSSPLSLSSENSKLKKNSLKLPRDILHMYMYGICLRLVIYTQWKKLYNIKREKNNKKGFRRHK